MNAEDVVGGPLGPYAAGFRGWLTERGYHKNPARNQMRLVAHLSGWLAARGLDVAWLGRGPLDEYLALRREQDLGVLYSPEALLPLLGYLRSLGVVAAAVPVAAQGPTEELLGAFCGYLRSERALCDFTVGRYQYWATRFLGGRGDATAIAGLRARDVHAFVLQATRQLSVPAAKQLVSSLRALLRFLHVSGVVDRDLLGAVPGVRTYSLSHLPRGLNPDEVSRLLAAPKRSEAKGLRDYAVLVMLARLGLRAGELAALELDDIDWRRGELTVRGKGRRVERLPLPADVGEALATYLRAARPSDGSRALFLTVQAPRRPLGRGGPSAGAASDRSSCAPGGPPASSGPAPTGCATASPPSCSGPGRA